MVPISLRTQSGQRTDIFIEKDLFNLATVIHHYSDQHRVIALIDQQVDDLYGAEFPFEKIVISTSEKEKSLRTVEYVIDELLALQADRDIFLLGIGGGITTDICGFVASIYKRGVKFGFIPTTLLAMVDAAIGGKNGVNVLGFKNMIGTFRQPCFVFESCQLLRSFAQDDFIKAVPEILKAFLISGSHFDETVDFFANLNISKLAQEPIKAAQLQMIIYNAVQVKCAIVEEDETDQGRRRLLNLGHTFAHAIEHCTHDLSHGEAVGIGLTLAAHNSSNPLCESRITEALKACRLPYSLPSSINKDEMREAIAQDKKNTDGLVNLVVVESIGNVYLKTVSLDDIRL